MLTSPTKTYVNNRVGLKKKKCNLVFKLIHIFEKKLQFSLFKLCLTKNVGGERP